MHNPGDKKTSCRWSFFIHEDKPFWAKVLVNIVHHQIHQSIPQALSEQSAMQEMKNARVREQHVYHLMPNSTTLRDKKELKTAARNQGFWNYKTTTTLPVRFSPWTVMKYYPTTCLSIHNSKKILKEGAEKIFGMSATSLPIHNTWTSLRDCIIPLKRWLSGTFKTFLQHPRKRRRVQPSPLILPMIVKQNAQEQCI